MRPTPNINSSTRVNIWNSPIPYLFGGLALLLLLIALSLALLIVCSFRNSSSSSSSSSPSSDNNNENTSNDEDDDVGEKEVKPGSGIFTAEQPKIVVIMPGEEKPTCLAMPAATTCRCNCGNTVKVKNPP